MPDNAVASDLLAEHARDVEEHARPPFVLGLLMPPFCGRHVILAQS